jgi:hypothetical protein
MATFAQSVSTSDNTPRGVPCHVLCKTSEHRLHDLLVILLIDSIIAVILFFSEFGTKPPSYQNIDFQAVSSALMGPQEPPRSSTSRLTPRGRALAERICIHLVNLEDRESDAWKIDDYRVSRMTVGYAAAGNADPWNFAFWMYYGKTLPKALKAWDERAAEHERAIARMQQQQAEELAALNSSPKKPVASVRQIPNREKQA